MNYKQELSKTGLILSNMAQIQNKVSMGIKSSSGNLYIFIQSPTQFSGTYSQAGHCPAIIYWLLIMFRVVIFDQLLERNGSIGGLLLQPTNCSQRGKLVWGVDSRSGGLIGWGGRETGWQLGLPRCILGVHREQLLPVAVLLIFFNPPPVLAMSLQVPSDQWQPPGSVNGVLFTGAYYLAR